ncbi:MAG: hypothetical protein JXM70_08775 [Pirellulales bacterium]|nr:hypothetical protein [Pirellulales bacterium]
MSADQERSPHRRPLQQPLPPPALDDKQQASADQILAAKTKANRDLLVEEIKFATNPRLRSSTGFDRRKKLVMAEVLKLIADSLDPQQRENLQSPDKLARSRNSLKAAKQVGVGQMLKRLKPLEQLANQLIIWKANSSDPKSLTFRKNQVTLFVGPNHLIDPAYQKLVKEEMKQTNMKISRGLYRSFMFMPLDKLEGQTISLIPYLRMAGDLHFHILGGIGIENRKDELGRIIQSWKFRLNDVDAEEQDILANASFVINELEVRDPYTEYHESGPLTCGTHYAFGAQMTKYFQKKRDGQWYIPVLHAKRKMAEIATVNRVDTREDYHTALNNRFNYAYYVSRDEESAEAGTRIFGNTTVYPVDEVDTEEVGNQIIPRIQSQARVTRNRIYFYLITQLERWIGGQVESDEVQKTIRRYLDDLQGKNQIKGFKILQCKPDSTGANFQIKLSIRWSSAAESFEIDAESADAVPASTSE